MKMIECKCGCGTLIEEKDKYGRKRFYISGHNNRKYDDPTQYKREWNHRNRETRYEYKKTWLRKQKITLIRLSGGYCECCGITFDGSNECMFDFHHRDPKQKIMSINRGTMNKISKDEILKEYKKCSLVCANCHRLIHNNY